MPELPSVEDLMSRNPVTVDADQSLKFALKTMRKRKVNRLPVTERVSEDRKELVGILTVLDAALAVADAMFGDRSPSRIKVSEVMSSPVITISPGATVLDAAQTMLVHGVSGLPVLDGDRLVGMITKTDLLELVRSEDYVALHMVKDPITVSAGTSLLHARRLMFEENAKVLPVVERERLVGLLTDRTLALELARLREKSPKGKFRSALKRARVDDVMRTPISVRTDYGLVDAAELIVRKRVPGVPVVNYQDEVVGVITKTDLLHLLVEELEAAG
ncbi:CBS domain-containing protein [Methanopyrus kandleri]|uniref:CBS-domain-containing protein n=2 Tax=Methanopyrus kandleri TaxID=2320 RepID=Q8TWE5_METKA|nr:CBS domain-containing protein [Methanopyrus kandleri]AAM02303.1 CBS-domain-containing protein [Methanopyrus kandleri AV19]HII69724.1 CBS domain-containing protein [Methanopyrus kandleri]